MKKFLAVMIGVGILAFAGVAGAAIISFTPNDAPGVVVSPPLGPLAPGGEVGNALINFGVDFGYGGREGIFNDPPLAFGGVNPNGILDLVSPVDGRIVVAGTMNQGLTNFLYVEAGLAEPNALLLEVFGLTNNLIASAYLNVPVGDNGRYTATIDLLGNNLIAFFRVSGADSFGVNMVKLENPVSVPEPGTILLLGSGLIGMALAGRRFRK